MTMYCVMVNDVMYPGSLSYSKEGAWSYLGDAKHGAPEAVIYLARVEIVKIPIPRSLREK